MTGSITLEVLGQSAFFFFWEWFWSAVGASLAYFILRAAFDHYGRRRTVVVHYVDDDDTVEIDPEDVE